MISRVVARSSLTDVTDASRFKRFLAGVANELDGVYYQLVRVADVWALDRATGEDLDRRVADLQPLGLVRLGPRRATGNLVFSRRVVTADTRIIPAGTVVLTNAGLAFRTLREVEITPTSAVQIAGHVVGQDSIPVPAVAIAPGSSGNVVVGAVRRLQGSIVGVDDATNVSAFVAGRNGESDDQLRARAKAYLVSLARCGARAIEYAAIGLSDGTREVVFARAIRNPLRRGDVNLWIDDGNGTAETTANVTNELVSSGLLGPPPNTTVGGEEFLPLDFAPVRLESAWEVRVNGTALVNNSTVFLSPTDGELRFLPALPSAAEIRADYVRYTGLIPVVQQTITGIYGNADLPGWGAAGNQVRVRAPRVVSPAIAGTLFLSEGTDRASAILSATDATTRLVNGGGISDDVVIAQIIEAVMGIPGVTDFVPDLPTENVVVLDDEIARITSANVDYD
jgi:uncharacterized phage protein gp47/JayE